MVETRQKNLKAFIFMQGDEEETLRYVQKNLILLKKFLLVFTYTLTSKLREYLNAEKLHFIENYSLLTNSTSPTPTLINPTQDTANLPPQDSLKQDFLKQPKPIPNLSIQDSNPQKKSTLAKENPKTLTFHRTIRSGEEIISPNDVTIFGRINSGALLQVEGNLQVYGESNGNIFCNGDYMILGAVKQGNVLFCGEILEKNQLQKGYKKIYRKKNEIVIEEL